MMQWTRGQIPRVPHPERKVTMPEEPEERKRNPTLINRAKVKKYLLDEARTQGKRRLERVSGSSLDYLERELVKVMERLVSMQPHSGPKTITPPS